ncbi:MAG: hemerythrin domain-containing protein [Rhodospirillales bacterium]|nr:hemerythrin domain-containing protein [Rhodospirillales bacterium]
MKLTDALLGEHAVLYELFDFVRDKISKSDDLTDLRSAVSVLERLLVSHAQTEEALLFPALEPYLGEMGPLAVMRGEHSEIEDLLEAVGQAGDAEAVISIVTRLLNVVNEHFHKEEQVLFPMARQCLNEETLTTLGDEWAARRNVIIDGKGCGG